MRVCHLAWEYPPLVHGGLGRHVEELSRAQLEAGSDVGVLTCSDDVTGTRATSPPAREHSPGGVGRGDLDVVRVGLGRPWRHVVDDAAAWQSALVEAVPDLAPTDVLHAHDWMVADAAAALSQRHGLPWVLTVHATEHGRRQGRLDEPVHRAVHAAERRAVARAERVVVCSQAMRAEVVDVLGADPSSVVVVPGAVNAAAWALGPAELGAARQRWRRVDGALVVAAGRLEWEKGFSTLLRALPALSGPHPGLRMVLAGEGSYRTTLDSLVRELRLDDDLVQLPGRLDQPDLAGLIATADLVVLPSRYEPFGLVVLEAMAAGACVVATRTGGLAETIEDGETGVLVEVGDVDGLAAAVDELLRDPERRSRLAHAGRLAVQGRTWAAVADRLAAVYASMVSSG
jgi:glycogen(starch) synthase